MENKAWRMAGRCLNNERAAEAIESSSAARFGKHWFKFAGAALALFAG
jgi:hypothetical protein